MSQINAYFKEPSPFFFNPNSVYRSDCIWYRSKRFSLQIPIPLPASSPASSKNKCLQVKQLTFFPHLLVEALPMQKGNLSNLPIRHSYCEVFISGTLHTAILWQNKKYRLWKKITMSGSRKYMYPHSNHGGNWKFRVAGVQDPGNSRGEGGWMVALVSRCPLIR